MIVRTEGTTKRTHRTTLPTAKIRHMPRAVDTCAMRSENLARVIGSAPFRIAEHRKGRRDLPHPRLRLRIAVGVRVVHSHERAIGGADHRIFRPRRNPKNPIMVSGHGPTPSCSQAAVISQLGEIFKGFPALPRPSS